MVGALLALVGCAGWRSCAGAGTPAPLPDSPTAGSPTSGILAANCESSAVVPWMNGSWLIGDNETSDKLFVYDRLGRPTETMPLAIQVEDIEAIAVAEAALGARGHLLTVGSHSRNKNGEEKPDRKRMVDMFSREIHPDLAGCANCQAAAGLAPNAGGLNIEGAAYISGELWLGLRAPLDGTKAILLNEGADGTHLIRQLSVDLDGAGIRDLISYKSGALLVGGPVDDRSDDHSLWWLETMDATPKKLPISLPPRTEGIATTTEGIFYVTDGDGKNGKCKIPSTWGRVTVTLP